MVYLIGGPADLTKKAVNDTFPYPKIWKIPVFEAVRLYVDRPSPDPEYKCAIYEMIAETRQGGIYEYVRMEGYDKKVGMG